MTPDTRIDHPRSKVQIDKVTDRSPLLMASKSYGTSHSVPSPVKSLKSVLKRMKQSNSPSNPVSGTSTTEEILMTEIKSAEAEFICWMDSQVDKINNFFIEKENEALDRFPILEQQLRLMYEHRRERKEASANTKGYDGALNKVAQSTGSALARKMDLPSMPVLIRRKFPKQARHSGKIADEQEETDHEPRNQTHQTRDYTRRNNFTVTYTAARRQLKIAVMEFYKSLELLKGYRALNHTGIRKMMKKFDKTVNGSHSDSYMAKLNQMQFAGSEALDGLLSKTENLYSNYFENGNHKHAVEKLRAKEFPEEHYSAMFFTGLCLGLALPLFIQGLFIGIQHLADHINYPDTVFLFQVWGGFFLVNLMLMLFMVNLFVWTRFKINYPFIFEFDGHDYLDYRQYGEIPAFMMFLLSLFGWLTFNDFFPDQYPAIYFPPLYLGLCVIILLVPLPILHWKARRWFLIAMWRLLLSGLYPVEFRDFFLGDILCSLSYSISNASFFFCLYATHWKNVVSGSPAISGCSSSKSRLLGFLNCLPGIWRLLQCFRRFGDSGDWFPHLANAAKYICLILYYMFLSIVRIDHWSSPTYRALFIFFATINALYSSFWDILMDFSLGQTDSKNLFLRDELSYKHYKWTYYVIMILDPILRFSWVFYAAYSSQIQQSATVSFIVSLVEIIRRFLWAFFRVENEHCTNVGRFRAVRDLTLPYEIEKHEPFESLMQIDEDAQAEGILQNPSKKIVTLTSPADEESRIGSISMPSPVSPAVDIPIKRSPSRRDTIVSIATPVLRAVSTAMRSAHAADFERRKVDRKSQSEDEDDDDEFDHEDEYDQHNENN